MNEQEKLEFAKKEIERLKEWLDFAERTWDVHIRNMEMGELKEYKEICQRNENVMNILEDYVSEKEKNNATENNICDTFPEIVGEDIEMFFEGEWIRGKVVEGYRFKEGIVTMEIEDGKTIWCGQDKMLEVHDV